MNVLPSTTMYSGSMPIGVFSPGRTIAESFPILQISLCEWRLHSLSTWCVLIIRRGLDTMGRLFWLRAMCIRRTSYGVVQAGGWMCRQGARYVGKREARFMKGG